MSLLSSFLFALSASLDAFLVGISTGIRKTRITLPQNLLISLITLAGTVFSIRFGQALAPLLPPKAASRAGSALLILMGTFYLIQFMWHTLRKYLPDSPAKHFSSARARAASGNTPAPPKGLWGLLAMGIALSLNNIGIGVGASIAGISCLSAAVLTFLFSVTFLFAGNRLGRARLFSNARAFAEPLSGLLLIGLGLL